MPKNRHCALSFHDSFSSVLGWILFVSVGTRISVISGLRCAYFTGFSELRIEYTNGLMLTYLKNFLYLGLPVCYMILCTVSKGNIRGKIAFRLLEMEAK